MQVVLITGCGSGLGRSLARCFQDQRTFRNKASRFRVFASDISLQSIADLELEGIETLQLDVTQPDSVEQAVKHIERLAGRIDILVCNAGVIKVAPILEENVSEIQAVWNVNTVGPLLCARAVAPIMIKQRAGIVAVTGSVFAEYTAPFNGAYASSKAAVTSLFDALRLELAPFGVSVCIIEPGFFSSKLRNESFDANKYLDGQSVYSSFSQTMSDLVDYQDTLRYVVSADEVAKVVVKKICSKRGPPPRILVGTYSWVFKFAALLYKYVAPRLMHTAFVFWFGLRMRNQRHV